MRKSSLGIYVSAEIHGILFTFSTTVKYFRWGRLLLVTDTYAILIPTPLWVHLHHLTPKFRIMDILMQSRIVHWRIDMNMLQKSSGKEYPILWEFHKLQATDKRIRSSVIGTTGIIRQSASMGKHHLDPHKWVTGSKLTGMAKPWQFKAVLRLKHIWFYKQRDAAEGLCC